MKRIKIITKENSLFADEIILCEENPKDCTKKNLQLMNEFSKSGYKISTHKSL